MRLVRFDVDRRPPDPVDARLPGWRRAPQPAVELRIVLNRPEYALLRAALWCRAAPRALARATLGRLACRWLNRHGIGCRGRTDCWSRGGVWTTQW